MRRLILASASRARRHLLKELGLAFTVVRSRAAETKSARKGYPALVKRNALAKAREVASRFDKGIVIGADTVVVVGGKIMGKPRDIADARRTLRALSGRSHIVYSGVAVVDAASGSASVASDRTRIRVCRLSGREIERYISKVMPLDKAGSFDIRGLGGVLIDRIEGCYYNVVGLPVAKLARMLKRHGVDVL